MTSGRPQGLAADREHWARFAEEWVAWARRPNHDSFWSYRRSLADFIGAGAGAALDLGCGEGRVARELLALGYRVTAVDPVRELLDAARQVRSAHHYAVAEASRLPFNDGSVDLVVAYNVLMDVEDLAASVGEMRRVVRPTGRIVFSVVHPFTDRGRFAGSAPDAPFVLAGSYFEKKRFSGIEERDGLQMHFSGWSQSLEAYTRTLTDAGLVIAAIREPTPEIGAGKDYLRRWTRLPLFLWVEARRAGS